MSSSIEPNAGSEQTTPRKANVLAAVVVLCVCAAVLPAPMARPSSGVSKEECLVLVEDSASGSKPLTLLERCSALYPRDVELLGALGQAYEVSDPMRAERAYINALTLDPGYADLRLRLGQLLLRRGAARDAVREAEAALQVQPNRRVLIDFLAKARSAAGNP